MQKLALGADDDVGPQLFLHPPACRFRQMRIDERGAIAGRRGGDEGGGKERMIAGFDRDQACATGKDAWLRRLYGRLFDRMEDTAGPVASSANVKTRPSIRKARQCGRSRA